MLIIWINLHGGIGFAVLMIVLATQLYQFSFQMTSFNLTMIHRPSGAAAKKLTVRHFAPEQLPGTSRCQDEKSGLGRLRWLRRMEFSIMIKCMHHRP